MKYNLQITLAESFKTIICQIEAENKASAIRKGITAAAKYEEWTEDIESMEIEIVGIVPQQLALLDFPAPDDVCAN